MGASSIPLLLITTMQSQLNPKRPLPIGGHQILPLSVHFGAKNSLNLRMPETNRIQGGSMQLP